MMQLVVDKVANHQQFVPFVSTINNLCPPGMIRKSPVVKLAARAEKTSSRRRPPSSSAPKVSRVSNDQENHHHPHHKSATIEKTSIIEPKVSKNTSQQTCKSPAVAANNSCRSCVNNVHWTLCSSSTLLECMTLSKKQRRSWLVFPFIHFPNFIINDKSWQRQ